MSAGDPRGAKTSSLESLIAPLAATTKRRHLPGHPRIGVIFVSFEMPAVRS